MAFITNDGNVLQAEPWGRRTMTFALGIVHVFFMLSLINPILSMLGPQSEDSDTHGTSRRDYRPGSGPPRPPRRMGRPNTGSSNIYTPGPACSSCG